MTNNCCGRNAGETTCRLKPTVQYPRVLVFKPSATEEFLFTINWHKDEIITEN